MHELGLCDAMLKMIGRILKEEGEEGSRPCRVVLEIGELSGVVPRFMEESWKAVTDRTPYANTLLEMKVLAGYADCLDCGTHFRPAKDGFRCPACGGEKLKPVSGTDMTVCSIEI